MAESLRILILNNVCGPLTAIAKELIRQGHVLEFVEADPDSSVDLEQTKALIMEFNPDYVMQQNFNVYMLTDDFGEQLADWMETTAIKQVFWITAQPDRIGKPFLFDKWLNAGYFKNGLFLCTSKAMCNTFTTAQLATEYLPIAIEASIAVPIDQQQTASNISFFSTNPNNPYPSLSGETSNTTTSLITALDTQDAALRYILTVVVCLLPDVDQQQLLTHILNPIRGFLAKRTVDYAEYEHSKQVLQSELQHLPERVTETVLTQLDHLFSDFVSFGVYKRIKRQLSKVSGSPFWDAIDAGRTEIFGPTACRLDNPSFEPGLVVSFSDYITMDSPSAAPLAVMATGNMSLSEYREELSLLIPQEYLLTYRTLGELTENLNRYQQNPAAFTDQKVAAQEHILSHHTYEVRAQQLVDKVNRWLAL